MKPHPKSPKAVQFLKRIISDEGHEQTKIAAQLKISRQSLHNMLSRGAGMRKETYDTLLEEFPEAKKFIEGENFSEVNEPTAIYRHRKPLSELNHTPNGKSIPFYDTEIFASFERSMSDYLTMSPVKFISIPLFNQGEGAFQVTGHSMRGYINHGDWVVVKRVTNRDSIIYGEPHLVITVTDNIKTVKFIKQSRNPKKFTLMPYNVEQFEPQDIFKSDVQEIWRVIGLFRTV